VKPKSSHFVTIKRMLRYIRDTIDSDMLFLAVDHGKMFKLLGYIDLNCRGHKDDRKSTARYIFLVRGALISWYSRKEPMVALSSYEAEYITTSLSACQVFWLMNLIEELSNEKCDTVIIKKKKIEQAVIIKIKNIFATNLAKI
jgi:hypothetical protein